MDNFDEDSLNSYITNSKKHIITKLDSYTIYQREMRLHSDLLCMVLDYSPKIVDEIINKSNPVKF